MPMMNGKKKEKEDEVSIGEMVMAAAAIGFVAWGVSKVFGMLKAAAAIGFVEWGASKVFGMLMVAAAIGFVAWGVSKVFGSTSDDRKTMKAPGRGDKIIYRGAIVSGKRKEEEEEKNIGEILKAGAGAAAVIGLTAWGVSKVLGSTSEEPVQEQIDDRKKMKAPGRPGETIFRDDFDRDPSDYFFRLRNEIRNKK